MENSNYAFSSDHGRFQNSSPWVFSKGPIVQGYPLLKSVGRCGHGVTAMDDMSAPHVLVSLVAGWAKSPWKLSSVSGNENTHWTIYRAKTPSVTKRCLFLGTISNSTETLCGTTRFINTQWKQRIQSIPLTRWDCFLVAKSNSFNSHWMIIPNYMARQWMTHHRAG